MSGDVPRPGGRRPVGWFLPVAREGKIKLYGNERMEMWERVKRRDFKLWQILPPRTLGCMVAQPELTPQDGEK